MKILFTLLLTLLFNLPQKHIKLMVIDKKTQEELIGVKVIIDTTTYYTDFDGILHVDLPSKEHYDITVEYPAYHKKSFDDVDLDSIIIEMEQK